jgi:hypothetical protein
MHSCDLLQIWLYMAVFAAGEQINYCPHILHLRAPCRPLFFSALGDEQIPKQYRIISGKTMVEVSIYT